MASASVEILILSIDTATATGGGVAVSRGARAVSCRTWSAGKESHSSRVLQEIDLLLAQTNLSLGDVQLFAALIGPGSFTSLRIGLATIKSFAATLARPCAGVPTLTAVARAAGPSHCTLACLPAGRDEVFWQLFGVAEDLTVTPLSAPAHQSLETLLTRCLALPGAVLWAGYAMDVYGERIIEFALERDITVRRKNASDEAETPTGSRVARGAWVIDGGAELLAVHAGALAWNDFVAGRVCSAAALQAMYVRRAEAEAVAVASAAAISPVG